jgi:hypothetical protein
MNVSLCKLWTFFPQTVQNTISGNTSPGSLVLFLAITNNPGAACSCGGSDSLGTGHRIDVHKTR